MASQWHLGGVRDVEEVASWNWCPRGHCALKQAIGGATWRRRLMAQDEDMAR